MLNEVLSSVLNAERLWCASQRHKLDKLHSNIIYSAVGLKFIVNDSAVYVK